MADADSFFPFVFKSFLTFYLAYIAHRNGRVPLFVTCDIPRNMIKPTTSRTGTTRKCHSVRKYNIRMGIPINIPNGSYIYGQKLVVRNRFYPGGNVFFVCCFHLFLGLAPERRPAGVFGRGVPEDRV